jgi:hypothetical protein
MLKVGADGNGIVSIEKTGTSGIVDTYTITFDDGNKTTFDVTNGSSIASIEKTATVGNVDTYTITLTNGETSTFTVTNGTGSTASDIDYDNTTSGLSATKVQGAIDELSESDNIKFDNTGTDLTSTNTEDVIKEVNEKTKHGLYELWKGSTSTTFAGQTISINDVDTSKIDSILIEVETFASELLGGKLFMFDLDVIDNTNKTLRVDLGLDGKLTFFLRNVAFIITSNSISMVFSDAYRRVYNSYGSSAITETTDNTRMIPYRVLALIHND